jgi:hypothetical protein
MARRTQIAMTVSGDKRQHPERYCPVRRCLWKTATVGATGEYVLNADPCRKHDFKPAAERVVECDVCDNRECIGGEINERTLEDSGWYLGTTQTYCPDHAAAGFNRFE